MPNWKKVVTSGSNAHLNHITASGNISASGTVTMLTASIGGGTFTSASLAAGGGGGGSGTVTQIVAGDGLNGGTITSTGTISVDSASMGSFYSASMNSFTTAGSISASGNVIAAQGRFSSRVITDNFYEWTTGAGHIFHNNITASGNISSSGTSDNYFGGNVNMDDNKGIINPLRLSVKAGSRLNLFGGNSSQGFINFLSGSTNTTVMTIDAGANRGKVMIGEGADASSTTSRLTIDGDLNVQSHITASGNISASGDILATGKIKSDDEIHLIDAGGDTLIRQYVSSDDGVIDVYANNSVVSRIHGKGVTYFQGSGATGAEVAIGTTNAAKELTVEGSISASGDLFVNNITASAGNFLSHITASGNISSSLASTGSFGRTSTTTLDLDSIQGNWTNAGNTVADLGTITTIDINGGTINGITDLAVADGGTGVSSLTDGGVLLGSGTSGITAMAVLTDGQMIVGDGSTDPVAESGATLRTSIGVGTGDNVEFTNITGTGNTALGNGVADTHTFVGHITASGNISSSGATHTFGGQTTVSQITASSFQFIGSGTAELEVEGHITASGNISSSGTIIAEHITSTDDLTATDMVQGGRLSSTGNTTFGNSTDDTHTFTGHITASGDISVAGDISASGDVYADDFVVAGVQSLDSSGTTLRLGYNTTHTKVSVGRVGTTADFDVIGNTQIYGHITASGNISASGASHTFGGNITANSSVIASSQGGFHWGDSTTAIYSDSANSITIKTNDEDTFQIGTYGVKVPFGNVTASGDISSSGNYIGNRRFNITSNTDATHQGDIVYFGGTTSMDDGKIYHYKSDGTWELADADAVATSDGLLAVALGAASDTNGMLLRGMVTLDHDPGAVGDVLFLATGGTGQATATAPSGNTDIVRVVGYCLDASNGQIWFNPSSTFVEVSA